MEGGCSRQAGSLNANLLNGRRPSFCAYAIKQPEKGRMLEGGIKGTFNQEAEQSNSG